MNHVENRARIVDALRRELMGPDPHGPPIVIDGDAITVESIEALRVPRTQQNGDEILIKDRPTKRYGVAVLYPAPVPQVSGTSDPDPDVLAGLPLSTEEGALSSERSATIGHELSEAVDKLVERDSARAEITDDDNEIDLAGANAFRPSTMALTFRVDMSAPFILTILGAGGSYRELKVKAPETHAVHGNSPASRAEAGEQPSEPSKKPRRMTSTWWVRKEWNTRTAIERDNLRVETRQMLKPPPQVAQGLEKHSLDVIVIARPEQESTALLTVALINRSRSAESAQDGACLFQVGFKVSAVTTSGRGAIVPHSESFFSASEDLEEQELELLYRKRRTYAIGHGCSADWDVPDEERVLTVAAEALPVAEVPSTTAEVRSAEGISLSVSMNALASDEQWPDGMVQLRSVVAAYQKWIGIQSGQAALLPPELRAPARRNLDGCERAAARMTTGLKLLVDDAEVRTAFQAMNHAMLVQQIRSANREVRRVRGDGVVEGDYLADDALEAPKGKGKWRAFQIAFILMNLQGFADPSSPERAIVELIWFPTGGGKTEAYLAIAAFHILLDRIRALATKQESAGTAVIMRYTLRLLTAQQFQRAAALICALEKLRLERPAEYGNKSFTIGVWVGMTPNTRQEALAALTAVSADREPEKTVIVLERCPWCRAKLGAAEHVDDAEPRRRRGPRRGSRRPVHGYRRDGDTIIAYCPDANCRFHDRLPVAFIDEDIYETPPTFIIGTVDKFAVLAWRPEARSLFGRDNSGEQVRPPPGLIIQDEFHLISGPLGSMVGLYETAIDELCTDRRRGVIIPKIVTSTATVRRFKEQARSVFGRGDVRVFPPPALDIDDSFFSRTDTKARGKCYVGVNAPGLGSMQTTQVRVYCALLQAGQDLAEESRDPWWTILGFFNSLRELGGALTLFNSDIPDYMAVLRSRRNLPWLQMRKLRIVRELTGRLEDQEVVQAIGELEVAYGAASRPVDVCLASNIIEVGVDIDRLSLMTVTGQPKTTSQYIQVTGRVGRRWWEQPGLVVTMYGAAKPRDRSHYEKFRTYHERLYAEVEPTSVTPMSRRALERALHAVFTILVRQTTVVDQEPPSVALDQVEAAAEILRRRIRAIGRDGEREERDLAEVLARRLREFEVWSPHASWSRSAGDDAPPLLRYAGRWEDLAVRARSWETPTSMRSVDAECSLRVSQRYIDQADTEDAS